jgi:ubiquinone/menaquinone biosynthesis C-methylase UbiE
MAEVRLNSDSLFRLAEVHRQMAQFLRESAGLLQSQGNRIVDEFSRWKTEPTHRYADQWLHPSIKDLNAEIEEHEYWYRYFSDLGNQTLIVERALQL